LDDPISAGVESWQTSGTGTATGSRQGCKPSAPLDWDRDFNEVSARGDEGSIRFDMYLVLFWVYKIRGKLVMGIF
jgi:hypothetical protein